MDFVCSGYLRQRPVRGGRESLCGVRATVSVAYVTTDNLPATQNCVNTKSLATMPYKSRTSAALFALVVTFS